MSNQMKNKGFRSSRNNFEMFVDFNNSDFEKTINWKEPSYPFSILCLDRKDW